MSQTSLVSVQLNVLEYSKWLYTFIWPIDWTLTGTTTPRQSGPESNDNEGVLHIPQSSRTEVSPSDSFVSYPGHSWWGGAYCTAPANRVIACLVNLIWMVCEMSRKWSYRCYFVEYCFPGLFKTASSILV